MYIKVNIVTLTLALYNVAKISCSFMPILLNFRANPPWQDTEGRSNTARQWSEERGDGPCCEEEDTAGADGTQDIY